MVLNSTKMSSKMKTDKMTLDFVTLAFCKSIIDFLRAFFGRLMVAGVQ